jgi:replicative DNA helicase
MLSEVGSVTESSRIERLPPQNVEAEEAVLGALLIDPDAIIRVASILRPEDFYREKHGWIYDVALSLHDRREPIDFLTVCDELERRGQLDELGGPAHITSLINAVPTSIHVEH